MEKHYWFKDLTKIPFPHEYIRAFLDECSNFVFNEHQASEMKGQWIKKAFDLPLETPLDIEIGTGNGLHFSHQALSSPNRALVGFELKYKPLIQAIRRVLKTKSEDLDELKPKEQLKKVNARMVRYHASFLSDIFEPNEISNCFIHFPDPWPKKRQNKNRSINLNFLNGLYKLQKNDTFVEFKTDSEDYFESVLEQVSDTEYILDFYSFDYHKETYKPIDQKIITFFENIFVRKGQPIYYLLLRKKSGV